MSSHVIPLAALVREVGGLALRFEERMALGALTNPSEKLRFEAVPGSSWKSRGVPWWCYEAVNSGY